MSWRKKVGLFLLTLVVAGVAWCGWLWWLVPRVESFPPEPGSVSDQPFASVFTDAASTPGREDVELIRCAEALLTQPVLRITDKPYRAPAGLRQPRHLLVAQSAHAPALPSSRWPLQSRSRTL